MKFLNKFLGFFGKAEEVIDKVDDGLQKAQDELDSVKDKLNQVTIDSQKEIGSLSERLAKLGTIQFAEISEEEFTELVKGATVVEGKLNGKKDAMFTHYYNGPFMVAMKVRWPQANYHFSAIYQTNVL